MDSKNSSVGFKYSTFMAMAFVTVALAVMSLTYDLIDVHSFAVSAAAMVMPLYYALQDSIAEIYGYSFSRKVMWFYMFCALLFAVIVTIAAHAPSPQYWSHQQDYEVVFGRLLRAYAVGAASVLIGSFLNIYLITKWKVLLKGRKFWLRSSGSSIFSEAIYSLIAVLMIELYSIPTYKLFKIVLVIKEYC